MKTIGIVLLVIAGLFLMGGAVSPLFLQPVGYVYEGKELLATPQEYAEFKQYMASPDVTIRDIDILNDDYPKLISYSYETISDGGLYGEKEKGLYDLSGLWIMLLSIPFVPGGVILLR